MLGELQTPFAKTLQSTAKKADRMRKTKAQTLKLSC